MAKINSLFKISLIYLLRGYQLAISPFLGHHCRFFPSCSQYMLDAIKTFGILRGVWLGLKRLLRCHPGCSGGVDLLPVLPIEKIHHD